MASGYLLNSSLLQSFKPSCFLSKQSPAASIYRFHYAGIHYGGLDIRQIQPLWIEVEAHYQFPTPVGYIVLWSASNNSHRGFYHPGDKLLGKFEPGGGVVYFTLLDTVFPDSGT